VDLSLSLCSRKNPHLLSTCLMQVLTQSLTRSLTHSPTTHCRSLTRKLEDLVDNCALPHFFLTRAFTHCRSLTSKLEDLVDKWAGKEVKKAATAGLPRYELHNTSTMAMHCWLHGKHRLSTPLYAGNSRRQSLVQDSIFTACTFS
jgi:hypothetical protein